MQKNMNGKQIDLLIHFQIYNDYFLKTLSGVRLFISPPFLM